MLFYLLALATLAVAVAALALGGRRRGLRELETAEIADRIAETHLALRALRSEAISVKCSPQWSELYRAETLTLLQLQLLISHKEYPLDEAKIAFMTRHLQLVRLGVAEDAARAQALRENDVSEMTYALAVDRNREATFARTIGPYP